MMHVSENTAVIKQIIVQFSSAPAYVDCCGRNLVLDKHLEDGWIFRSGAQKVRLKMLH